MTILRNATCFSVLSSLLIASSSSQKPVPTCEAMPNYYDVIYQKESSRNYRNVNKFGYVGAYQMGVEALIEAGFIDKSTPKIIKAKNKWESVKWRQNSFGVYSKDDFLNSESAQDYAVRQYTDAQWRQAVFYNLDKYVGTTSQGISITKEGIMGMAHNQGVGNTIKFLANGEDTQDGFGTKISTYAKLLGKTSLNGCTGKILASDLRRGREDALVCNTVFTYVGNGGSARVAKVDPQSNFSTIRGVNRCLWNKIGVNDPAIRSSTGELQDRLIERRRDADINRMQDIYDTNPELFTDDFKYCISRKIYPETGSRCD